MAATVGATLGTVAFPLRHAGMGPFKSSAGNIYFFGRDTTNTGTIEPHKASDPMTSFTAQTAKTMSSGTTTAIEAGACYQVLDVIHVVTQISTGQAYYNSFNMATDAWTLTTSETAVAAASFAPTTNYTFVTLVVRSNGNVVIGYAAGQTAMTSGFNMCRYRERTGVNTYSTAVNVDNGGSVDWNSLTAVLGTSDRVHFFLASRSGGAAYQRTLTAANALQTFPASFDSVTVGVQHSIGAGVPFSGTVAVPFMSTTTNRRESVARLTSADAPTASAELVSNVTDLASQGQSLQALSVDGSTLHYLYPRVASPTNQLAHDNDGGSGTWGADVDEWGVTSLVRISSNVYDRSGTKLAMVVDENSTIKYAEIALAAPPTPTSLIFPTNDVLTQLRRR